MPRPDRAVDQGLRLADQGACVPWDAIAAIERAQADVADRRALAKGRQAAYGPAGGSALGRLRQAFAAISRARGRSR